MMKIALISFKLSIDFHQILYDSAQFSNDSIILNFKPFGLIVFALLFTYLYTNKQIGTPEDDYTCHAFIQLQVHLTLEQFLPLSTKTREICNWVTMVAKSFENRCFI